MNEAVTLPAQSNIPVATRLLLLLARLVTTCRGAGARTRLRPAEETLISRSTGGRC
jgi:hypothetical protein